MNFSAESLAILGGAMALAGGLGGAAAGMAIAGYSGIAIMAEDPKNLKSVIILAALPMSRVFYGFIILIFVLTTVTPKITTMPDAGGSGFAVAACCVIAASAFLFSGIYQGNVCSAGISALVKTKGKILTNSIMLAVFVELIAVLGLVFTIMALSLLNLM